MRVPWTARRSNQSILKEINPEYSLEGLMLKLKLAYSLVVHFAYKGPYIVRAMAFPVFIYGYESRTIKKC